MICLTTDDAWSCVSPNNWSAVLGSSVQQPPAALHGSTNVWSGAREPAAAAVRNTRGVRASSSTGDILIKPWASTLKFHCVFLLMHLHRVWCTTGGGGGGVGWIQIRWLVLELFFAEKASTRSPYPIQGMEMPRLMKIWLQKTGDISKWSERGRVNDYGMLVIIRIWNREGKKNESRIHLHFYYLCFSTNKIKNN